ncbi:MAG: hypothetical protein ACRDCJ_01005 [Metamycoplasmataceae bacterium]
MINKKMKIIAASTLTGSVLVGVGLGLSMSYVKSLETNLTTKFKNSITISNFINNIGNRDFITTADFDRSIKLMDGETEITDYSNMTINEAYINNYFKFEVPSKVKFYADKEGIEVYIKNYNENTNDQNFDIYPSNYNSSSVEFKIWFGKGEGKDRVEDYIIIYGAGLNGFKKTQEELDVRSVVNLFQNSISLKKEFYNNFPSNKTIKDGVFAKSIEPSDIVSNLTREELKGVNWNVTSVEQDRKIPSKLNVNIDFYKGRQNENFFSQTFINFEINGFPIEMGVDDYESKVNNFIKDEKNKAVGEAFKYERPEEQPEGTVGTVLENYRNNAFSFDLPFSFQSAASNAGVEYIFKPWSEDSDEYSAFPDEEDSEIPKFKIFVRSGSETPFEYEEFFTIRGEGQVINIPFDKTENNDIIDEFKELTTEGSENPFTNETIVLRLINEFAAFNDRSNITSNIIAGVNDPLNNIELSLDTSKWPPTIIIPPGLIISATEVESILNQLRIKVEISLGKEFEDKSSFSLYISYPGFKTEQQYNKSLIERFITEINNNVNLVTINTKRPITLANTNAVKESIRLGDGDFYFYQEIFVGFDEIMDDFKWSSKPTFEIDFQKTRVEGDNIIFSVTIKTGIESQTINITREISSFYN